MYIIYVWVHILYSYNSTYVAFKDLISLRRYVFIDMSVGMMILYKAQEFDNHAQGRRRPTIGY